MSVLGQQGRGQLSISWKNSLLGEPRRQLSGHPRFSLKAQIAASLHVSYKIREQQKECDGRNTNHTTGWHKVNWSPFSQRCEDKIQCILILPT